MQMFFNRSCPGNGLVRFLVEKKYRFWRHFLVWIYVGLFFIATKQTAEEYFTFDWAKNIIWNAYFLLMFYLNMYVLIPVFLYKGKYVTYLVLLPVIIVGTYLSLAFLSEVYLNGYVLTQSGEETETGGSFPEFIVAIHMLVLMVFASTSLKLFQRWAIDSSRISELETNSLQLELRELRNQVHPHFLFNMLNNVNVLVRKDPDKAVAVIHKLSDFLRYQLYESNTQSVLLLPEIQFLNDFMELEKTRRDDFSFTLDIENHCSNPDRLHSLELPPNLFISFVENAIKHSADADMPSSVSVRFKVSDDKLEFNCTNTKPEETPAKKTGGLGLANVKRRLELLYGDRFDLGISRNLTTYELKLTLPL